MISFSGIRSSTSAVMEIANDPVAQRYSGPSDNVVKYDPTWTTLWHRFSKNAVDTSGRMFAPRALLDYAPPLPVSGTWRLSPSPETTDFSLVENEKGDFARCNFLMNYHLLFRRRTQIFVPEVWNDGYGSCLITLKFASDVIQVFRCVRTVANRSSNHMPDKRPPKRRNCSQSLVQNGDISWYVDQHIAFADTHVDKMAQTAIFLSPFKFSWNALTNMIA